MHTEQKTATRSALKNCPRCGQTHTDEECDLCEACKQPKPSRRTVYRTELTFRKKQIVEMVSKAKFNKEIAYELHLF